MHRFTLFALAAGSAIASGVGVAATQVQAQSAPPAPGMDRPGIDRPGIDRPGMGHDSRMGPGRDGWRMHGMMARLRQFSLIYPAADRGLSGPDVQKIAEAFLLFNGNHTWKVMEVTEQPDSVKFAFATPDGTTIAHFAMNRHTGRPERLD